MFFNRNQTEFRSDYQQLIWRYGTHIVPPDISLAEVADEQIREGCMQVYECTMEILEDMYCHLEDYEETPRWYTGDYLVWLLNGSKPIKHHLSEYTHYLEKIPQFGFKYNEDLSAWSNVRYPMFCEYFLMLAALAKERKQNMGGYLDRRDFRLLAGHVVLTLDDFLRPLSDVSRAFAAELHKYALSKGMKMEKSPYAFRYVYKKLYSLIILNNPFCIEVPYRLDNGKHVPGQLESFLDLAKTQPDADEAIRYIQGGIYICNACNGLKKAAQRCGSWVEIQGVRRLASMCHPAITGLRRGARQFRYSGEDIRMLKRMVDLRVEQVDAHCK